MVVHSESHGQGYAFKYTFNYESDGATLSFELVTEKRKPAVKNDAKEKLTRTVSDADDWNLKSIGIAFHDPPWETHEELVTHIRAFDDVSSVRLERPMEGGYSPPKIHIRTHSGSEVVNQINEFYPGIETEQDGELVVAYPSPITAARNR